MVPPAVLLMVPELEMVPELTMMPLEVDIVMVPELSMMPPELLRMPWPVPDIVMVPVAVLSRVPPLL